MALTDYKLVGGQHVQADLTAKPVKLKNPATGEERVKYPSKTYNAGDLVPSEVDLVEKHGPKFVKVGPSRKRKWSEQNEQEKRDRASEIEQDGHGEMGDHDGPVGEATPVEPDPNAVPVRDLDGTYGPLEAMSADDLRDIAEEEKIEVPKNVTRKADLIKLLRTAVKDR